MAGPHAVLTPFLNWERGEVASGHSSDRQLVVPLVLSINLDQEPPMDRNATMHQ